MGEEKRKSSRHYANSKKKKKVFTKVDNVKFKFHAREKKKTNVCILEKKGRRQNPKMEVNKRLK